MSRHCCRRRHRRRCRWSADCRTSTAGTVCRGTAIGWVGTAHPRPVPGGAGSAGGLTCAARHRRASRWHRDPAAGTPVPAVPQPAVTATAIASPAPAEASHAIVPCTTGHRTHVPCHGSSPGNWATMCLAISGDCRRRRRGVEHMHLPSRATIRSRRQDPRSGRCRARTPAPAGTRSSARPVPAARLAANLPGQRTPHLDHAVPQVLARQPPQARVERHWPGREAGCAPGVLARQREHRVRAGVTLPSIILVRHAEERNRVGYRVDQALHQVRRCGRSS
jgi:hypothetical protein